MRSKAPLILIELVVMFAVFALAAGLCAKAFVWSEQTAADNHLRDRAVVLADNAAQVIKSCSGDFEEAAEILGGHIDEERLYIFDDAGKEVLTLKAKKLEATEYLGEGTIEVATENGKVIFDINVCWQEVTDLE